MESEFLTTLESLFIEAKRVRENLNSLPKGTDDTQRKVVYGIEIKKLLAGIDSLRKKTEDYLNYSMRQGNEEV